MTRGVVDLRKLSEGDEVRVELDADKDLTGRVAEIERQEASAITKGYIHATVAATWNGEIPAKATIDRLTLRQEYARRHGGAREAQLHADVWPDDGGAYQRVVIGTVEVVDEVNA